nr:MAG TPA: hypothetical protein [Caudoviricetes sp.]
MSISNFAIVKNKQFAQYKPMFFVQYTEKRHYLRLSSKNFGKCT